MFLPPSWTCVWAAIGILLFQFVTLSAADSHPEQDLRAIDHDDTSHGTIPLVTREYWIRYAIDLLAERTPLCNVNTFGAVIVNHTDTSSLGNVVCDGFNTVGDHGDPTLHGEMVAIRQCFDVLQKPPYSLTFAAVSAAVRDLTLYTTAEPCPMCSGAIRWTGFRECVYGTSIDTLIQRGWVQMNISSAEIFARSDGLGTRTALFEGVLRNETDPLFVWQFDHNAPCPKGCNRNGKGHCVEKNSDL
ncbi:tRNA-specific adenosine deaminase [Cladobotryum mycophilum]|uniref:tRNA-specific adenosine deaminase n=1 Tax=Cladobotryum mycophilum TaxID=491253 RepID=A0ABR0SGX2_9HYPO